MAESVETFRLLTRSDFDGFVCAVLLNAKGLLGEIRFAHPKDVQDGKVEVTDRDIIANLPYVEGCHQCFDHHASEEDRNAAKDPPNLVLESRAPSAARVIWEHYGGADSFPGVGEELLESVDKADSAQFSREEVLDPQGWVLLSFLMDPRTGLGRFREFRVSNRELMEDLIGYCSEKSIGEILALPDVAERVELYREHQEQFEAQLRRCAKVQDNVVTLDLREEETIFCGNRFMVYALFPECKVSVHVLWGREKQNTVLSVGRSIFDRSSTLNIGKLCAEFGGGGHRAAGTCQVDHRHAELVLADFVRQVNSACAVEA